jgi:molybdopterin molybdotransferase
LPHDPQLPLWQEARDRAAASVTAPLPKERLEPAQADRRVLAQDYHALTDLPPYATSAMDGWAISGPGPWQVVGTVLAGHMTDESLISGTAVVIATGAVIPPGATAVVRSEHGVVKQDPDGIGTLVADDPEPEKEIRPAALECTAGETLAPAGTLLTPAAIGLLAAAGHDELAVRAAPRAAILVFGDELLAVGLPDSGRVRDSLGPQLPGWLLRLSCRPNEPIRVPDVAAAHKDAIRKAFEEADIVVTTGGTAAGPVDHLHTAIADLDGQLVVDSVASRPGHPMLLATFETSDGPRWLLGLPGNPQSAIVALMTLGQPVIDGLLGREPVKLESVVAASDVRAPRTENRLVPGNVSDGRFAAGQYLGSAMLRGLASSAGFGVLPPGGVTAGEEVRWLPLPR